MESSNFNSGAVVASRTPSRSASVRARSTTGYQMASTVPGSWRLTWRTRRITPPGPPLAVHRRGPRARGPRLVGGRRMARAPAKPSALRAITRRSPPNALSSAGKAWGCCSKRKSRSCSRSQRCAHPGEPIKARKLPPSFPARACTSSRKARTGAGAFDEARSAAPTPPSNSRCRWASGPVKS